MRNGVPPYPRNPNPGPAPRRTSIIPAGAEPVGISASEFGFAYDSCARCWWDKRHGVAPVPESFATVLRVSASAMEKAVTVELLRGLGIGAVSEYPKTSVKSAAVFFPEVGRAGFIHGKLDRAFVLQNPAEGEPIRVSYAAAMFWTPDTMKFEPGGNRGYLTGATSLHPAKCAKATAEDRLKRALAALTGPRPESGRWCDVCRAVDERAKQAI